MDRDYIRNMAMQAPGLAIDAGDHTLATNANAFAYKIKGRVYKATAGLTFPAMTGITIDDGKKIMVAVLVDDAGAVTYTQGEPVDSADPVVFPDVPQTDQNKAVVGFILMDNATGLQWVGGTDDIDASGMTSDFVDAYGFVGV